MAVTCHFEIRPTVNPIVDSNTDASLNTDGPSELLTVTITGMTLPLSGYFQIMLADVVVPRSTTPTDSFRFATFNAEGEMLDSQTRNVQLVLSDPSRMTGKSAITSSSEVVAAEDQIWEVEFTPVSQVFIDDQIQLTLPKWDPRSEEPSSYFSADSYENGAVCSGGEYMKMSIDCEITKGLTFDTIRLTNPYESQPPLELMDGVPVSLRFSIGFLRNPMSGAVVSDFEIVLLDSAGGQISDAPASLSVTEFASTMRGSVRAVNPNINELNTFRLSVGNPVPLAEGCHVEIFFPKEIVPDSHFNSIQVMGLFGARRTPEFSINSETNSAYIPNACSSYVDVDPRRFLELRLGEFKNPWYVVTPDPIVVKFYTQDEYVIFQTTRSLTFTTTPGGINTQKWYAGTEVVDEMSTLLISVQPLSPTYSADAQLIVQFPLEDFPDPFGPCRLEPEYAATLVNPDAITCESVTADDNTNSLVITQILSRSYEFEEHTWIDISVEDIRMPSSTRPTGTYTVSFYDNVDGTYMLVDQATLENQVQVSAGQMSEVTVSLRDPQTYYNGIYDFNFDIRHIIPAGGSLFVQLPSELHLLEDAICIELSQTFFSDETYCEFSPEQNQVVIVDPQARERTEGSAVEVPECSFSVFGIRSQRASRPTSLFRFESRDKDGYMIDAYYNFILDAPPVKSTITDIALSQTSTIVGDDAMVEFTFRNPVPLIEGDLLILGVPPSAQTNLGLTFRECRGSTWSGEPFSLSAELHCLLRDDLNSIQLTISLDDQEMPEIPWGSLMHFRVHMLRNPGSTKPSDPFSMKIMDSDGFLLTELTDETTLLDSFRMGADTPAEIYTISVALESRLAWKPTTVKFVFLNTHPLPAGAVVDLIWPEQLTVVPDEVEVWTSTNPYASRIVDIDEEIRLIRIFDVTEGFLHQNQPVEIQLSGVINSRYAAATDSFEITTRLDEVEYLVDHRDYGLEVELDCDYPCTACRLEEPSTCLTCDVAPESELPFYFFGECLVECPSNYLPLNYICTQCDGSCLECEDTTALCTKCHPDMYLQGNTCLYECPDTHHPDPTTGLCVPCDYPCMTCQGTTTTCTRCSEYNLERFLFDSQCHEECPVDISVNHQGSCVACDDSCLTCAETWETCTSCRDDIWLDMRSANCVDTCPVDVSVATVIDEPEAPQSLTCAPCTDSCLYCDASSAEICQKCREGFSLWEAKRECVDICPDRTHPLYVSITDDTLCLECADGCSECQYSSEHCLACDETHLFYDFQCLVQCPPAFEQKSATERECVRVGDCYEYGYEVDPTTGLCVLSYPHCEVGFILNNDLTECIPLPTWHMPFIFLYAALIWTVLILMKQNRQHYTKEVLVSQLLIGYTALQQITYGVMWFLSFPMGYPKAVACHTVGLFAAFFLNLVTLVAVLKLIEDRPFHHWRDRNHKASVIFIVISALFSYKAIRLFYSELFQKPYFNAAYEDKYRTMIRPVFVISMIGLLQVVPVGFADAWTIWQIEWGYELKTLAIENLVLAVIIFSLEIYEYMLYRDAEPEYMTVTQMLQDQKLNERAQIQKMTPSLGRQIKVMGGVEDDDEEAPLSPLAMQPGQGASQGKSGGRKPSVQMDILGGLIKKMDEKRKIKDLNRNLDALEEAEQEAKEDQERRNGIDTSIKMKRQLLFVKRQKFEAFRNNEKKDKTILDMVPDMPFEDLGPNAEAQQIAIDNVKKQLAAMQEAAAPPVSASRSESASAISVSESTSALKVEKLGSSQERVLAIDPTRTKRRRRQRGEKSRRPLEIYEARSDDEKARDKVEYDRFLIQYKEDFDARKQRCEIGHINPRETESFDENLNREMYDEDDCAVASDFHTEVSWISYPPTGKGYWQNNPPQEAKFALFAEKIKSKFHYANAISEQAPIIPKVKRDLKMSRKTQTLGEVDSEYDPFDSDNDVYVTEGNEEDEELSEVDPSLCRNIFAHVLDGVSDSEYNQQSAFEFLESEDSDALIERTQMQGRTRKRARADQILSDDVAGDLSVDSEGQMKVDTDQDLRDKAEQQISRKGYLVDGEGNIVDKQGNVVFARDEISEDGDIPDRLRQEHRKKQQLQGQQKADLTIEQYMQDQRLDEIELLAQEDAVLEKEMDQLKDLSMEAPTEPDPSVIEAAEKAAVDEDDERIHKAFEIEKTDSVHEQVVGDFKVAKATPRSRKGKSELERAYKEFLPAEIFEKETPKREAAKKNKKKKSDSRTVLDSDGVSAYLRVQDQVSGSLINEQVGDKGKYQATDDGSRLAGSNLPFQPTQGNISSSEMETTNIGGQTALEAKKFLMMYDSEGSISQNQVSPLIRGALTVGHQDLPSDIDTSAQNQHLGHMSEHNVSMPTVQPRGENDTQLSDSNFPQGLQFMRDSLPGDMHDRQKFDKFKYGYMFDFHKPQTPREETVRQSSMGHAQESERAIRPVPFTSLGPDLAPYKAKRKHKDSKQALQDQRRAQMTCGSERIRYLENIYLKRKAARSGNNTFISQGVHHKFAQPPQFALTTAQKHRHYSGGNRPNTAMLMNQKKRKHNNLKKQNFVEDGMNIMMNAHSSLATSHMLDQSQQNMQYSTAQPRYSDNLQGHINGIGLKKELNAGHQQQSPPQQIDNYFTEGGNHVPQRAQPPMRVNNTLNQMINGHSVVSSIQPMSDMASPDKMGQGNNLVSDMQSAFNNLRPFDSDATGDEVNEYKIDRIQLNEGGIAAGGQKLEETIDDKQR